MSDASLGQVYGFFRYYTGTGAVMSRSRHFHQELLPTELLFTVAAAREGIPFPAVYGSVHYADGFEILREAGVRLPKQVGQAMSIVERLLWEMPRCPPADRFADGCRSRNHRGIRLCCSYAGRFCCDAAVFFI
jgi:hypothetical protein